MLPLWSYFQRDRHVTTVGRCRSVKARKAEPLVDIRMRRGHKAQIKTAWRRIDTGTNHISAHGVWRDQARRAMLRINRTGETRWHRLRSAALSFDFLQEEKI